MYLILLNLVGKFASHAKTTYRNIVCSISHVVSQTIKNEIHKGYKRDPRERYLDRQTRKNSLLKR